MLDTLESSHGRGRSATSSEVCFVLLKTLTLLSRIAVIQRIPLLRGSDPSTTLSNLSYWLEETRNIISSSTATFIFCDWLNLSL